MHTIGREADGDLELGKNSPEIAGIETVLSIFSQEADPRRFLLAKKVSKFYTNFTMDVQLKELIEKVKSEGVEKAEAEAQVLLSDARKKAANLIAEAEAKALAVVAQAESAAARWEASGRDALKQASRDMLLALEKKILSLFQAAAREGVDAALVPSLVEKLALELARAWAAKGDAGVEVILGGEDAKKLGEALRSSLAKTLKGGVEIVPSDRFTKGVRVAGKGSSLTVDLSASALAELLADSLQPALAEILRDSVR